MKLDKVSVLFEELGSLRLKYKEKLLYQTLQKSDQEAEYFYIVTNRRELIRTLEICFKYKIKFTILGGGSRINIPEDGFKDLVIKNRSSQIKIISIKGKVGLGAIGVDEATIDIDSGVTFVKLNEYLESQGLQPIPLSNPNSTVGASILMDEMLKSLAEKVLVWEEGEESEVGPFDLNPSQVVIGVIIKRKAN